MKTFTRFMVITALAATLSGCLGGGEPDIGKRAQALNEVDAETLPADLMSCNAFYGADWDTPDALLGVKDRPEVVVLVQAGEMVCLGQMDQLELRLLDADPGTMLPLGGKGDAPVDKNGGLNLGGRFTDSPVGDSNPLPANPGTSVIATDSGDADDSNPLPANPGADVSATDSGDADDSNPLPARFEITAPVTDR